MLGWHTLRLATLDRTWILSGVSWFQWLSVEVHLDRHTRASGGHPKALTLLGGAGYIAWYLRHSFLGECRGNFLRQWTCLGLGSAPGSTKKALCHTRPVGWTYDKYRLPSSSRTWQFPTNSSTSCTNTYFIYMFGLFNALVSPTLSSSVSSFWVVTDISTFLDSSLVASHENKNKNKLIVFYIQVFVIFEAIKSSCGEQPGRKNSGGEYEK